jgi:hypothetical protein
MAHMGITSASDVPAAVAAPTRGRLTGPQANWAGEYPAHRPPWAGRELLPDPAPTRLPRATRRWQWTMQRQGREHRPLAVPLLISLLIHAVLFSLTFGGDELGLPGLAFPWRDRRIEVPDLHVVLTPAHVAPAEPAVMSAAEPSLSDRSSSSFRCAGAGRFRVGCAGPARDCSDERPRPSRRAGRCDAKRSRCCGIDGSAHRRSGRERLLPLRSGARSIDVKRSDGPWSVCACLVVPGSRQRQARRVRRKRALGFQIAHGARKGSGKRPLVEAARVRPRGWRPNARRRRDRLQSSWRATGGGRPWSGSRLARGRAARGRTPGDGTTGGSQGIGRQQAAVRKRLR